VSTRRTKFGLTLVRHPNTWWRTEDDRWEISEVREIIICEAPHPVRIGREAHEWALANRHRELAQTILSAVSQGKQGYVCPGYEEHDRACGWGIYAVNHQSLDSDLFYTLTEAWQELAKMLEN
jgi:hypothetical protein